MCIRVTILGIMEFLEKVAPIHFRNMFPRRRSRRKRRPWPCKRNKM
jgi:hypothetical protein